MENEHITYTYELLDSAIELFSQPLLSHQIAKYSFEVFIKMLALQETALFLEESENYSLIQQQLYALTGWEVPFTEKLKELPIFHAGIMTHHWDRWFAEDWIATFQPKLVIPLVMKHRLFGWIVSKGTKTGELNNEQLHIAHSLMYLVHSALERSEQHQALKDLQHQFEKNLYAMMALQTFTTSLLTQNSTETLYDQAVDAFSELARSRITSLTVWDDWRQRLVVVAYHNQMSPQKKYGEFYLRDTTDVPLIGRLYELGKDDDVLNSIFTSTTDFTLLSAKYIIFLGKERILGFVTLSESVVIEQNERLFETIQLLASITYLAIVQARRWEEVIRQRDINERKVHVLSTLHHLTENLGRCSDLNELLSLTRHTLIAHAKVEKMFIAFKNHGQLQIQISEGVPTDYTVPDQSLEKWFLENNTTIYDFTIEGANNWLSAINFPIDNQTNCLIAVPFWHHCMDDLTIQEDEVHAGLLGCLCVMAVEGGLSEDYFLMIDTIAHNLQPFLMFLGHYEEELTLSE